MNANDYLIHNFRDLGSVEDIFASNRRDFLKRVGGGIVIFMAISDAVFGQEGAPVRNRPRTPGDFNAFLRIGEDGQVTVFSSKIEMGQGVITSLPQMVAEELDVPLSSVAITLGDTDEVPWDAGTWGSMSTRGFGPPLRAAAAEAKGVLISLAADKLKVPAENLVAKDGVISEKGNEKNHVTYGELAKGQKIERHLDTKPGVKKPADFKVSGQPHTRRDGEAKVTGAAHYAADIRVPGMVYAKILRPPMHGAKLKSADTSAAKAVPGAQVVEDGDFIAVLHEFPDVADNALAKIKADWDKPEAKFDDQTVFDHLQQVGTEARTLKSGGDLDAGKNAAKKKFEATYLNPYVAHSPMETHAALCQIEGDKATVWVSTQNPFGARQRIAEAIGFPEDKVRVITPYVGGGFGGKTDNQQGIEAARLAKAVGKPVQVMWSREEEFFYDTFRPAAVVKIASGVDGNGKMAFWDYDVFFAGDRGAAQFYSVANHRTASRGSGFGSAREVHPFATGSWRAPGNNTNTYARESHIEAMAAGAGVDPVQFRLDNLDATTTDGRRIIGVLKAAAEKFGWTPAKGPSKRGYGVACGIDAGTYVAGIAEMAVDADGNIQVKRVVIAQDMGVIVNPEGAAIQLEGCVSMGLGYALVEEVHFKGGEILDTNYDAYELPRFVEMPKIEHVFVKSEEKSGGGGEPAIVLMGALVANGVYDATGARLYQLPMTPERVKAAMAKI
jgi:isoquinoline 1-oxidoreductase